MQITSRMSLKDKSPYIIQTIHTLCIVEEFVIKWVELDKKTDTLWYVYK